MKVCKYKAMIITAINISNVIRILKLKPLHFADTVCLCLPFGFYDKSFPSVTISDCLSKGHALFSL